MGHCEKQALVSYLPPLKLCARALEFLGFQFVQMLVIYMTAGGACPSASGLLGTSVYWYLEGLSPVTFGASFSLFFFSRAQKLSPMNSAADTMKKLEA